MCSSESLDSQCFNLGEGAILSNFQEKGWSLLLLIVTILLISFTDRLFYSMNLLSFLAVLVGFCISQCGYPIFIMDRYWPCDFNLFNGLLDILLPNFAQEKKKKHGVMAHIMCDNFM